MVLRDSQRTSLTPTMTLRYTLTVVKAAQTKIYEQNIPAFYAVVLMQRDGLNISIIFDTCTHYERTFDK